MVLHSVDPLNGVVSVVVKTFFNQRIDLQITPQSNGYYKVELEDGEPPVLHHLYTLLKGSKPTYSFKNTVKGKAGLSIISDDWVMFLDSYNSEFDLEQAVLSMKVTIDGNGTPNHEIWYGVEELSAGS